MKSKADNSIIYSADNTEDWPEIEKELSEMEFDVPPISEDRLIQLHSLVLEKAGLKKKKKSPRRAVYMRLCACAAVALFAVLGVFALPGQLRLFGAESNEPDSKNAAAEVCNDTASLYDGIYYADDAVGTGADGEMPKKEEKKPDARRLYAALRLCRRCTVRSAGCFCIARAVAAFRR